MEPEKEAAHDEAMLHMKKATELLRESLKVHEEEVAGRLSQEDAIPMALSLNEQAGTETDLAAEAMRDFLGDDAPNKD